MSGNKLSDKLIRIIGKLGKYRAVVLSLAIVVVFVTTYLLILPAFTLEKTEAAKQGGIDLPVTETTEAVGEKVNDTDNAQADTEDTDDVSEDVADTEESSEASESITEEPSESTDTDDPDTVDDSEDAVADPDQSNDDESTILDTADDISESGKPEEQTLTKETDEAKSTAKEDLNKAEEPKQKAEETRPDSSSKEINDDIDEPTEVTKNDLENAAEHVDTADLLKYEGENYNISITDKDGVLPDGTAINVEEIDKEENAEDYEKYYEKALAAVQDEEGGENVRDLAFANFYDISLISEGTEIEPEGDDTVNVKIEYDKKLRKSLNVEDTDKVRIIHFTEDEKTEEIEAEVLDPEENNVQVETDRKDNLESAEFDAGSFSVYAVVYTVDFHWEVNGKKYVFSIPGGGYVTAQQLIEVLGIANTDEVDGSDENISAAEESADTPAETRLTLDDVEISDTTREFVADVENVEFSSPDLAWVGKAENEVTVGELKEANSLDCQYSASLTEEQIDEINNSIIEAGDWALISILPFKSDETLTFTMKNGDQFVINVTDAQIGDDLNGKAIVIKNQGNPVYAMSTTSVDWEGNQHFLRGQSATGADDQVWIFEYDNSYGYGNTYRIKSAATGTYLKISNNNYSSNGNYSASLVDSSGEPTLFYIDYDNGSYSISTYHNYGFRYLNFSDNYNTPRFSFGNNEQRFTFEESQSLPSAGDWMLYFDDDFDEITIHVGETITLRPYEKWIWKDSGVDVQTNHWNIGGKDNSYWSQIDSGDNSGAHRSEWDDGGSGSNTATFHWTAFVKADDQLNTHYWSVQGRADHTGVYYLTNTKTGKTIKVNVVDGDPVNKPGTINKVANIKVNLFDYDKNHLLDPADDSNLANNGNNKSDSVNQMGGSNHFYFLSSGSGNNNNEPWNNYTKDAANPNLVLTTLGTDGYPVLNHGNSNTSLKYLFDKTQTSWHGGNNSDGMIAYPDVVGMFQKDTNGYYYFNSNTNYFYYDTATGTSKLYEHTYTQISKSDGQVNDKPIGFFPFHDYDATDDLYVNQNSDLNHHIGLSMELEFMLPRDKKDDNGNDIIFDFSGDDDLWVFVEWVDDDGNKQSKLLLDLGGVHQPIHGDINFTTGSNTAFMESNRPYTLKVFYLERGGCDSNCSIRFNLPIVQDLTVAKKLTGLTEKEKAKYKDEEFTYEIVVNGQPYNYPNPNNRYEKAILRDADGNDITPQNFTIVNGRFNLKDGQTLTITYLDRSDKFYVAELNTENMANFEDPNAERYYHQAQDASLYEEEIDLTACQTVATAEETSDCWSTPREDDKQYKLEDTEKVTFTNTLKEKNLEVEKKWKGNKDHPDNVTFTVSATVDDGNGGRTPYTVAELKEKDPTTGEVTNVDKVFTLSDSNSWRQAIEHLPVNTPDGKFIFYDISEGHVDGYVLTGSVDITAEHYNYCNVDVVKLWPDSNGEHTEILRVVLQNSAGEYYAGEDPDGEAWFSPDIGLASVYELKPGNNYTHRFARLPARKAGEEPGTYTDERETYTAVQLNGDDYSKGLATHVRDIIQYQLENTPLEDQIDPAYKPNTPEIHKRIDALRDGVTNPDSAHQNEDLTDLYRLYLDYTINSKQDTNGIDLLFVIDHSGSMNNSAWPGNQYRAQAVVNALNGNDGLISKFLAVNDKNRWAAVGFKGPDGSRDYTWALTNPWQPSTQLALTNAGQNGSEILSSGSTFNRDVASIALPNDGASILSNYTAGFWRAEQFLLDDAVKADGRKKVIVFITDGVPTLHIDNLNGSLQNAGTAAGSPYYHEENGGCPSKALTEFGYFVSDMQQNGYTFGGDNGNVEFYTVGLGASMQTDIGLNLMAGMIDAAYGDAEHTGHYMTITDATGSSDTKPADSLSKDLRIILGMNDTFSNLVIQDDLSKYVDLYGLAEGASASEIMAAAKVKVTMKVPDPDHPDRPRIITLYENGAPATSADAMFTNGDGHDVPIIQGLTYDSDTKTIQAVFDPEYQPATDITYTLSFDVKATDTAYTTYANNGYDKYTSGDNQGQCIVGDEDTDFLGTNPVNATSSYKEGFRSNDKATATYTHNNKDEELTYPHPVIQVAAKADIVKIDENGDALEGAKFNLYNSSYDPSKTIEENEGALVEADLQSKKPTNPAGNDAVIRSGKLIPGTYYLVETEAPAGYNALSGPVEITVTESNGILTMTAKIAGEPVGADKFVPLGNGVWKLSVQNSSGYELPHAGGIGTTIFYILGSLLVIGCGIFLIARRRIRE